MIVPHLVAAQYGQYSAPTYRTPGSLALPTVNVSGGWLLEKDSGVTVIAGEVMPTALNTEAGTFSTSWSKAGEVVPKNALSGPLAVSVVARTMAATTTTTPPIDAHMIVVLFPLRRRFTIADSQSRTSHWSFRVSPLARMQDSQHAKPPCFMTR